jgi:hypothetical protein
MNRVGWMRFVVVTVLALGAPCREAWAQVPPRSYWKTLSDANAVPIIVNSLSGNTNPFDPAHTVTEGSNLDATLALAGYAHSFSLFDRASMATLLVPMGRISGDLTVTGKAFNQSADGFGDPMLEFDINVLGPSAQKYLPDVIRYEPGISIDVLADLAFPIGKYDHRQPLNLGQNRWYGRLAAPVVWQLGAWVPGRRTTLELLPSVWFFADNDDYVEKKLETDPMFQLDAHLTRDFSDRFWASLDFALYLGGQSSIDGVAGKSLKSVAFGVTSGYVLNENLNLTFGYKATVFDDDTDDLRLSGFTISLVYGWHALIEGTRRLRGED